jgi:hypothetical protein
MQADRFALTYASVLRIHKDRAASQFLSQYLVFEKPLFGVGARRIT